MRRFRLPSIRRASRVLTLWALVLALPIYGCAGTLLQMLGPAHSHAHPAGLGAPPATEASAPPSVAFEGLRWVVQSWRAWQDYAHAQAHADSHFVHPHYHDSFERHHHDVGEAGVIAVDGEGPASAVAAELGSAAAAGSASLPLAFAALLTILLPLACKRRWSSAAPRQWRDALPRRHERPPQAYVLSVIRSGR